MRTVCAILARSAIGGALDGISARTHHSVRPLIAVDVLLVVQKTILTVTACATPACTIVPFAVARTAAPTLLGANRSIRTVAHVLRWTKIWTACAILARSAIGGALDGISARTHHSVRSLIAVDVLLKFRKTILTETVCATRVCSIVPFAVAKTAAPTLLRASPLTRMDAHELKWTRI
jgi:hypothetical protein